MLILNIKIARGIFDRLKGLLFYSTLPQGTGLLIKRTRMVHTFGMRFSIDLVFLSKQGRVCHIAEKIAPNSVRGCWRGRSVLELPAGDVCRLKISLMDEVIVLGNSMCQIRKKNEAPSPFSGNSYKTSCIPRRS